MVAKNWVESNRQFYKWLRVRYTNYKISMAPSCAQILAVQLRNNLTTVDLLFLPSHKANGVATDFYKNSNKGGLCTSLISENIQNFISRIVSA